MIPHHNIQANVSVAGLNVDVCTVLFTDGQQTSCGSALAHLCSRDRVLHCLYKLDCLLVPNNKGLQLLQSELDRKNETAGLFEDFITRVTQWIEGMNDIIFGNSSTIV